MTRTSRLISCHLPSDNLGPTSSFSMPCAFPGLCLGRCLCLWCNTHVSVFQGFFFQKLPPLWSIFQFIQEHGPMIIPLPLQGMWGSFS